MKRLVFDRWLTISAGAARPLRIAVWRRVDRRRRAGDLWSPADRAAMAEALRRAG